MRVAYIVGIVALSVLVLGLIGYYARLHVLKKQERARIKRACGRSVDTGIFIELISYDDAEAAARTLASALITTTIMSPSARAACRE